MPRRSQSTEDKITVALMGQELRTYIEEDKKWKVELGGRLESLQSRILDVELKTSSSIEERKGLRRDMNLLSVRVTAWDLLNSLAGTVLALFILRKS